MLLMISVDGSLVLPACSPLVEPKRLENQTCPKTRNLRSQQKEGSRTAIEQRDSESHMIRQNWWQSPLHPWPISPVMLAAAPATPHSVASTAIDSDCSDSEVAVQLVTLACESGHTVPSWLKHDGTFFCSNGMINYMLSKNVLNQVFSRFS